MGMGVSGGPLTEGVTVGVGITTGLDASLCGLGRALALAGCVCLMVTRWHTQPHPASLGECHAARVCSAGLPSSPISYLFNLVSEAGEFPLQ